MNILFKNFNIIRNGKISHHHNMSVVDDTIHSFSMIDELDYDEIYDGEGKLWLSHGFVDIHTHGGGGYDFMDSVASEYNLIAKNHARFGASALYPTTVSASQNELLATLDAFKEAKKCKGGARLLGIHLEGPYISKEQKGAMDEKYIREPNREEYEKLFSLSDDIKRMTIAPELPGASELGRFMEEHGIVSSIGHTEADFKDVLDVHNNGHVNLMTHLYSCMRLTHRVNAWRIAGAVEAGLYCDALSVELIADGCHLPLEILRMIYKFKPLDNIILVTDSMRAAGMGEGIFTFGSRKNGYDIIVEDGVAKLLDRSAFAGSVATTDRLVRVMNSAGIPLPQCVKMITENPCKAMNIDDRYGHLKVGRKADITVFDDGVNIKYTFVNGEKVFSYKDGI